MDRRLITSQEFQQFLRHEETQFYYNGMILLKVSCDNNANPIIGVIAVQGNDGLPGIDAPIGELVCYYLRKSDIVLYNWDYTPVGNSHLHSSFSQVLAYSDILSQVTEFVINETLLYSLKNLQKIPKAKIQSTDKYVALRNDDELFFENQLVADIRYSCEEHMNIFTPCDIINCFLDKEQASVLASDMFERVKMKNIVGKWKTMKALAGEQNAEISPEFDSEIMLYSMCMQ